MQEVLWVDMRGMSVENSVPHKLTRLLEESGGLAGLSAGMRAAIKINTSEDGYEYGLRPVFVRTIAELVNRVTGVHPTICDGIKLVDYWRRSGGKRSTGKTFMEGARRQGYTNDTLGGNLAINGGFSGDEGNLYSCDLPGSVVGGVEVGTAVCRNDALIVLSHVTLHPLFGLSGALLNGGFDCLIGREKTRVLQGLNPYLFNGSSPPAADLKDFQRRALECLLSVRKSVEGQIFYVNYLWDVTPQPEYFPYSQSPVVENLGFLASPDPVGLDAATFKLLQKSWDKQSHQTDLPGLFSGDIDFLELLKVAELLGVGSASANMKELS